MSYKLLKFCWFILLLIFFKNYSFAQNNNDTITEPSISVAEMDSINEEYENLGDTNLVKTIFEDANDSILKWKQSRDFGYMAYLDSLLRGKKDLKKDTVNVEGGDVTKNKYPGTSTPNNSYGFLDSLPVRLFLWIIAIFFIGFILYKLFFTGGLFSKNERLKMEDNIDKEPESLADYSMYNALIHEAELKNDFNMAVRYLYLQSLKKLAENDLVIFSPDKTNHLYVQELSGKIYQQEFSYLTLHYEYVWYGKFAINGSQYQKLKKQFILFNKQV